MKSHESLSAPTRPHGPTAPRPYTRLWSPPYMESQLLDVFGELFTTAFHGVTQQTSPKLLSNLTRLQSFWTINLLVDSTISRGWSGPINWQSITLQCTPPTDSLLHGPLRNYCIRSEVNSEIGGVLHLLCWFSRQ